jgi:hypothetical protein
MAMKSTARALNLLCIYSVLEKPAVDGRIIYNGSLRSRGGDMDWIDLAQDRGRRRTLVKSAMNFRVT